MGYGFQQRYRGMPKGAPTTASAAEARAPPEADSVAGAESAIETLSARGGIPGDQSLPTQRHIYFQLCDFTGDE